MPDTLIIQKHSEGLRFIVWIQDEEGNSIDLSPFDDFTIFLERPDFTTFQTNALLLSDGTDGKIYFITDELTFLITGRWKCQAIYGVNTVRIFTSIEPFMLDYNLDDDIYLQVSTVGNMQIIGDFLIIVKVPGS